MRSKASPWLSLRQSTPAGARHCTGVELSPARTQMLIRADEISRARRRVEPLRQQALAVKNILANYGDRYAVDGRGPAAIFARTVDINCLKAAAHAFQEMHRRPVA